MTLKSLFSFQGRFSRSQFWLWGFGLPALVGVLCVGLISALMLPSSDSDGVVGIFIVIGILYLPLTFVGIAGSVKRLHDLGRSGWWYLLTLIPLINVGFVIWIGAFRGSNGQNQFGGDPLQASSKDISPPGRWVLLGVTGQYKGCEFVLDQDTFFGTNPKQCSVIIDSNLYPTFGECSYLLRISSTNEPLLFERIPEPFPGSHGLNWRERKFNRRNIGLGFDLVFEVNYC